MSLFSGSDALINESSIEFTFPLYGLIFSTLYGLIFFNGYLYFRGRYDIVNKIIIRENGPVFGVFVFFNE